VKSAARQSSYGIPTEICPARPPVVRPSVILCLTYATPGTFVTLLLVFVRIRCLRLAPRRRRPTAHRPARPSPTAALSATAPGGQRRMAPRPYLRPRQSTAGPTAFARRQPATATIVAYGDLHTHRHGRCGPSPAAWLACGRATTTPSISSTKTVPGGWDSDGQKDLAQSGEPGPVVDRG